MRSPKQLGQNFLINNNVASREISYANITKEDTVLEIGPGKGILTFLLAESAKKVIAIEKDKHLFDYLKPQLPRNVQIINNDALKVDFHTLPVFNKIVSNLPFHISSPITFKFLEYGFESAVLIYQKDFAARMVAKPGSKNYSRLSVHIYYSTVCKCLETVPRGCFQPVPKVDSSIVEIIPRKNPAFFVDNEAFFFNLTRVLFNHRRKKIKNSLSEQYGELKGDIPYLDCRVEELTPEQIGELSNIIISQNRNLSL